MVFSFCCLIPSGAKIEKIGLEKPDVTGLLILIPKDRKQYTKHTRIVTRTRTNSKGETEEYEVEEDYYTWDFVSRENKHSEKIRFINTEFLYGTIKFPPSHEIDTVYIDGIFHSVGDIRYVYYGSVDRCEGTLYAVLENDTVVNAHLYYNQEIDDTIEQLESNVPIVLFWVVWVFLMCCIVCVFYIIDNKWLENKNVNS